MSNIERLNGVFGTYKKTYRTIKLSSKGVLSEKVEL